VDEFARVQELDLNILEKVLKHRLQELHDFANLALKMAD
jgi:hypothetical protein